MKNYIGFRSDQTLGRKNGGVIIYIKETEAVDAERLIAKSNSYVEYHQIHMQKCNIIIIYVFLHSCRLPTRLPWINNKINGNWKSSAKYRIYRRPELSNYLLANGNSRRPNTWKSGTRKCTSAIYTWTCLQKYMEKSTIKKYTRCLSH